MKRVTLGIGLWLVLGQAGAQQVWRCEWEGQVVYTDQPCEKAGRLLPARNLKANVADGLATEAARAGLAASATSAVASAASAASDAADLPASVPAVAVHEAVSVAKAASAPQGGSRERRRARAPRFAMQGLMDTDFVQRGLVLRRQNPASTPTP